MNLYAALPNYPPHSLVGAWVTTHEFLAHMVRRGHSVRVLSLSGRFSKPDGEAYEHDGVQVQVSASHLNPRADIDVRDADVCLYHLGDDRTLRALRGPIVGMSHAPGIDGMSRCVGDLVVANSTHTADALHPSVDRVICHPPINPDDYRTTPGDAVTLVNLSALKGGPLFWQLTQRLPDTEFLGVCGGYGDQHLSPGAEVSMFRGTEHRDGNVTITRPTTDMREVYSRTRVLLMPSERESYGRVALEAACSGIPTIAHPCDGLREALGDAAIWCDRNDPDAWVEAIRRLEDPFEWNWASKAALQRAALLDPLAELDRFAHAVEMLWC